MRYVIIGNSASGIAAVEGIREIDKEGGIVIISGESHFNYSRPLISYYLGKKIDFASLSYRGKEFYKKNGVELLLNSIAEKISINKKQVILSDGKRISFDKLLIATGGTPIIPEIKGGKAAGVFTFITLSDALKIEKHIEHSKVKNAIIIGGGLIGLKAAEALMELKIKTSIVELADRVLSNALDKTASGIIENILKKSECQLIANNTVVELKSKNNKVSEAVLKDGQKIPADLVILAIGVRPNLELVKNSVIKSKKGILVDSHMRTSAKDIYASGDCGEAGNQVLAIWPEAVKQGKIAGFNMALRQGSGQAGARKEYKGGFLMNSVELCGVPIISVGESSGEGKPGKSLVYYDEKKPIYKKIVLENGRIKGALFVGKIDRAGIYTGLIKDKIDTTDFKDNLLKEDFGLINLPKEYRKHLVKGGTPII
ncbi:MAG: FAD-dependent oxidoreductase [Candidatus Omnitrophota bacterium]